MVVLLLCAARAAADVPPGFDLFETDPEQTVFSFKDRATIPANFFDQGSQSFTGDVRFGGDPIVRFMGADTGDADTIVERPNTALLTTPPFPASTLTDLELRQLSLLSMAPIQVHVGQATQLWDVEAGVSPTRPSLGQMRIVQTQERGGAFDSQLTVYPKFTFTRLSDGETKVLDVGALPFDPELNQDLTLTSSNVPWRAGCVPPAIVVPGLNDGFCPGLTIPGRKRLGVEEGALARHGVLPAQPRLEHFGCYSVKPVKPFKARTVKLRDQFGKSKTRVLRALTLCNPARKNKEAWRNRRAHLACYGVKRLTGFKKRRVLVRNQFGSAVLTLLRPSSLCLPSLKTRVKAKKPKPLAAAQRIDHFACYAVKPRKKLKSRLFTATDQFGRVRQRALKITNLCAPVSKNGGRIQHRVRHLVCYSRKRVGGKKFKLRQVRVRNQFGSKRWRVLRPVRFCVPSLKIKL